VVSLKKETILQPFAATGIWPKNSVVIFKQFTKKKPKDTLLPQATTGNNWIQIERILRAAVGEVPSDGAKKLSTEVDHLAVQNQLINLENEGLRATLDTQKKYKKQKKILNVQQRKEY
jgi:hypothetical protein